MSNDYIFRLFQIVESSEYIQDVMATMSKCYENKILDGQKKHGCTGGAIPS